MILNVNEFFLQHFQFFSLGYDMWWVYSLGDPYGWKVLLNDVDLDLRVGVGVDDHCWWLHGERSGRAS